jgi:serine/threonine-protein kinase
MTEANRRPFAGAWAAASSEETRAFLQTRLALMAGVCAALSSGFLVVSLALGLAVYPTVRPDYRWGRQAFLFLVAVALLFGVVWWATRRGRFAARTLALLDAGTTTGAALLLALMGGTIPEPGGWAHGLVAASLLLTTRALAVPSSGKRTFAISASASLAATLAFALENLDFYRVIDVVFWLAAATVIATFGSRIIFGLRQQVRIANQIGQYVLKCKLGEGGMGVVYLATHAILRRETALKLLLPGRVAPATLARFEREVQQLARLNHPNTVAIYDYGHTPDGVFYFAMEYLAGLDLEQLVQAVGPLPPRRVVHLLSQVCGSLEEAHEMGLVHRDIKPANVLVCRRGAVFDRVKVLDFGLVKDLRDTSDVALTATDGFLGTPLYASPESIRAPDEVTGASDLYAVAAVGYYLVTGTHVFRGATVVEVCAAHLHGTPERPSERLREPLPEPLECLLLQGLSKDPAARPSSARAFRQALLACTGVGTWTEEEARAWWAETGNGLLAERVHGSSATPLESTVAVDLGGRLDILRAG